jgi:serine/threonine protein kinase
VAAKMVQQRLTRNDMEEFVAECKVMKNLRPHAHCVQFFGICDKPLCLVMEFCDNGSLYRLLHSDEQLSHSVLTSIIRGIDAGMFHLAAEGIVHRDLASRNILLDKNMQAKVSDCK